MNIWTILTICSAIGAYGILIVRSLEKYIPKSQQLSFSSFLLWLIIDFIMLANTWRAHNDPTLIMTFTILTAILTAVLICKKQYSWETSDTIVAMIAFACLVVSYITGPLMGVFTGALSIGLAGIPNLLKIPKQTATKSSYWTIYFFILAPLFSCINFYIQDVPSKEYIYPVIATSYWMIALFMTLLKRNKKV